MILCMSFESTPANPTHSENGVKVCQNVIIEALTDLHVAGLLPPRSQMTTLITAIPRLSSLISSSYPSIPLPHFLHIPLKSKPNDQLLFNLKLNSCWALNRVKHEIKISTSKPRKYCKIHINRPLGHLQERSCCLLNRLFDRSCLHHPAVKKIRAIKIDITAQETPKPIPKAWMTYMKKNNTQNCLA